MIVAVSGATGYIGRHLVARHLALGDTVRVLSRGNCASLPGVLVFNGDLSGDEPVPAGFAEGADVLYHCAAELRDASRMEAVNVRGTAKLIGAAAGKIGRWVQLSSVGAYGSVRNAVVDELSPERPLGAYEKTKTQADDLVREAAARGDFSYSMLRPSTVFSGDMPNQSLFQWVSAIQRGMFFFIGKRGAMVNYVHVESVVDALLLCGLADAAAGRTYIVSEAMEIERFVSLICKALERRTPRLRLPEFVARFASFAGLLLGARFPLKPSRVDALSSRSVYSSAKLSAELGYVPSISLEEGLLDFVADWRKSHGS